MPDFALALKILSCQGKQVGDRTAKWLVVLQISYLVAYLMMKSIYHQKPSVKEFYAEAYLRKYADILALPQQNYRGRQYWNSSGYFPV